MEYGKLFYRIIDLVKDPVGLLAIFFGLVFIIIIFKVDLSLENGRIALYVFALIFAIAMIGMLVSRWLVPSSRNEESHLDSHDVKQNYSSEADMSLLYKKIDVLNGVVAEKDASISLLTSQLATLTDKLSMSEKVRNWNEYEEKIDIRSIDTDLDIPERYIDRVNYYNNIEFHAEVDDAGNYRGRYIREGYRKEEGRTEFFYFCVGASSHIYNSSDLKLIVKDRINSVVLRTSIIDDNDPIYKVFKIELFKPLSKNDRFNIEISFFWPVCVTQPRDTDTINLSMFALGVERVRYELLSSFKTDRIRLYDVVDNSVSRSQIHVDDKRRSKKFAIIFEVIQPMARGYVLAFSRSIGAVAA